jgi:hypothetical protein
MSITINKLITRCRVPRRRTSIGRQADRVAHERLATAVTQFLGPALARHPRVVRIRRLSVKLVLPSDELDEDAFALAWAQALARSLFDALACATGADSAPIIRADSIAEFRAAFLRDLLTGRANDRWEYAEFHDTLRLPVPEAAVNLLLASPEDIVATLAALERSEALASVLARLDELSLERLFTAIAALPHASSRAALAAEDLQWVAQRLLETRRPDGRAFEGRRLALEIFVRTGGGEGRSPRTIFYALLALALLLESPELLDPRVRGSLRSPAELAERTGRRLPQAVAAFLWELHCASGTDRSTASASPDAEHDRILEALNRLRPLLPSAASQPSSAQPRWLIVDAAGVLLLARIVQRLGWANLYGDRSWSPWGEPRFFQILLAGIGSAVLGRAATAADALDPAVVLFAGLENHPDMTALRYSLDAIDTSGRRQLLNRLTRGTTEANAAADWVATFDALAAVLIREFASLVRGFRDAPREAIVRQFLRTPGRVQVGEQVMAVLLESSPYHVALHISGMDEPLPSVNWMGGRWLEIRLAGL